jgi:RNA 2',3'-cyclic 3'-phosphodiesterase
MARGGSKLRLFVALDLPEWLREGLADWSAEQLVDPALRPVRPESLHVTLVFLGGREPAEAREIAAIMRGSAVPAPLMKLEDPVPLPDGRRASAFALPAPSPATSELRHELATRLTAAGLFRPEERDFWPHVTVARVRKERRGARRPEAVTRRPEDLPGGLKEPFLGVRMTLYRSELQSGGSQYAPLAQVELP